MTGPRRLLHGLHTLLWRGRRERDLRDLEDELQAYVDVAAEHAMAAGASRKEAVRAARAALGSPAAVKDSVRDVGWESLVEDLWQDARYAIRFLRRSPGFSAVAVFTLALGIGANTTMFSAVNLVFLRPLPVSDPDALVRFRGIGPNDARTRSLQYAVAAERTGEEPIWTSLSYPMYLAFRDANHTLTDVTASAPLAFSPLTVSIEGAPDAASGFAVTGNFFRALGVRPYLGRAIEPADDDPSAPPVAVISHRYWQSRFAGDAEVVGHAMTVNEVPVTVVGVLPLEFNGVNLVLEDPPDVTLPLALHPRLYDNEPSLLSQDTVWWLQIMGRRRPGVSVEQVEASLQGVFQRTARAGLDDYPAGLDEAARNTSQNRDRSAVPRLLVQSARRGMSDTPPEISRMLAMLSFVVGLVLLLVCANVASLMLSRTTARRQELSVRLSLGATRGRLVRQLLTESMVMAFAGGLLGLAFGWWGRLLLPDEVQLDSADWRLLAFALALTLTTGVLFGTAPALRATADGVADRVRGGGRRVTAPGTRLGGVLVVAQVAVALVLLVGAGLLVRTVANLRDVDVGFEPDQLLLFRLNPDASGYDPERTTALLDDLTRRLQAVPGVRSVAHSMGPLLAGGTLSGRLFVQGRAYEPE